MYYKVVKKFGLDFGSDWSSYKEWRNFEFSSFESVDALLRPDLFEPKSDEDWDNCVNEDYKLNLITNLEYAAKVHSRFKNSDLVGVEIELETPPKETTELLGFDILDEYCQVSLLTNWGNNNDVIDTSLCKNGLIGDFSEALKIRNYLRKDFKEDGHAEFCGIWAIYTTNT
ncbi:hypothetical protein [Reinekea blandensis]|nr:hypothetical protein [Reinekea blandensis]